MRIRLLMAWAGIVKMRFQAQDDRQEHDRQYRTHDHDSGAYNQRTRCDPCERARGPEAVRAAVPQPQCRQPASRRRPSPRRRRARRYGGQASRAELRSGFAWSASAEPANEHRSQYACGDRGNSDLPAAGRPFLSWRSPRWRRPAHDPAASSSLGELRTIGARVMPGTSGGESGRT